MRPVGDNMGCLAMGSVMFGAVVGASGDAMEERVLSGTRESKKASKKASSQVKARWGRNSKGECALGWRVLKVDG